MTATRGPVPPDDEEGASAARTALLRPRACALARTGAGAPARTAARGSASLARQGLRTRRGGAAVEFALTLPVLLLVFAGIVDLSTYVHARHDVQRAAREGARLAAATRDPDGTGAAEAAGSAHALAVLDAVGTPCGSGCTAEAERLRADGWGMVRVRVTAPWTAPVGLVPGLADSVSAQVTELARGS